MQNILKYILIFCLLVNYGCAQGQENNDCLEELDQTLFYLEDLFDGAAYLPSDLEELRATGREGNYYVEEQPVIDAEYLFKDSYLPIISYNYPNTEIYYRYPKINVDEALGAEYNFTIDFGNNVPSAKMILKKINYIDGTSTLADGIVILKDEVDASGGRHLTIRGTKLIKNFDFELETKFAKEVTYPITDSGQLIKAPVGDIEVVKVGNGVVRIKAAEPMRHLTKVVAVDESGKQLLAVMIGNGGAYKKENLQPHIDNLKNIIDRLEKKEIGCDEVPENTTMQYIDSNLSDKENALYLTQYYGPDFKKASVVVWDTTQWIKKVYAKNSGNTVDKRAVSIEKVYEEFGYAVAKDDKSGLYGVIDIAGQWIIEPKFFELEMKWGEKDHFWASVSEEEKVTTYVLDRTNKTLRKEQ